VLGIARGKGWVRFGGKTGRIFTLKAGDVAILPAGTGHPCLTVLRSITSAIALALGTSFQLVNPPKAENCTRGSWRQIYSGTTSVSVNRFSRLKDNSRLSDFAFVLRAASGHRRRHPF
jgi:hypothetical protein